MPYSQHGEEFVILDFFKDRPPGRLLDIGAFDGKTFSNSLALIEKGWSGVMVEPNPSSLAALINTHRANPNVEIIGAVLVPQPAVGSTFMDFYTCDDAVSTSDPAMTKLWKDTPFRKVKLPAVGIEEFVRWNLFDQAFNFVTLDVEDNTLALAMKMVPIWEKAELVCIEHTVGAINVKDDMMHLFTRVLNFGLVADIAENFIFAKK